MANYKNPFPELAELVATADGGVHADSACRSAAAAAMRAQIEPVFGYLSQSMKGFCLRYIGRRSNAGGGDGVDPPD